VQAILHGAPYFFLIGMLFFQSAWNTVSVLRGVIKIIDEINNIWDAIVEYTPLTPEGAAPHHLDIGSAARRLLHWALLLGSVGFILVGTACVVFVSSPYLTRLLYGGKFCKFPSHL
jgi:hypothetical protein